MSLTRLRKTDASDRVVDFVGVIGVMMAFCLGAAMLMRLAVEPVVMTAVTQLATGSVAYLVGLLQKGPSTGQRATDGPTGTPSDPVATQEVDGADEEAKP